MYDFLMSDEPTVKMTSYVSERVRRALNIASARSGKSVGDILGELVVAGLPRDIQIADESIQEGAPPIKGKPGRKPRRPD